jgi:hypothetical protein
MIECPRCEGYFLNTINLRLIDGCIDIKVECETYDDPFAPKIDSRYIFFSLDRKDITRRTVEIPLELDWRESILGNDSYSNYIESVTEIRDLLRVEQINSEPTLLRLFYGNIISALETYLSDLIINAVNSDEVTLKKVIQEHKLFGKEKIELSDIFITFATLKESAIKALQGLLYHNLNIILPLYKNAFRIDFSPLVGGLYDCIMIRHDIVHRNGRDFRGKVHNITVQQLHDLIDCTNEIVDYVNTEFQKLGINIVRPDEGIELFDDLPF